MTTLPSEVRSNDWNSVCKVPELGDGDVHVWKATLDVAAARVRRFAETLSEGERARARRFSLERDRCRFIVCRGVLRLLLGRYLGTAPGSIEFCYGPHGKPLLSRNATSRPLRFNISHADGIALCGVAVGREIGIDVERIRADPSNERVAERFFCPSEVVALRALPPEAHAQAFFAYWTRKEAYAKARGGGFSLPFDRLHFWPTPEESAFVSSMPRDARRASQWSLLQLYPGPGYIAALALEGSGWRLWTGDVAAA